MNKIFITGNVVRDIEVKKVKVADSEVSVATLTVASKEIGAESADFFDVEIWRGQADNCAKYLKKGDRVEVVAVAHNKVIEKEGSKTYTHKFVAQDIEFASKKDKE